MLQLSGIGVGALSALFLLSSLGVESAPQDTNDIVGLLGGIYFLVYSVSK